MTACRSPRPPNNHPTLPQFSRSSRAISCSMTSTASSRCTARCSHRIPREQRVVCCLDNGNLKEITGEAVEEDFNDGTALGGPIICKCWSVVHEALQHCTAINAISPPLLPLQECPPIDWGCIASRNILRGGFVVVVDLETHVPNEGNIFRPILCIEDKVCNVFSPLVDIDSGGGRRRRVLRLVPPPPKADQVALVLPP